MTARRNPLVGLTEATARFWGKVQKAGLDDCWPWTSQFDRYGYGRVYFQGKVRSTHRIAYFLSTGNDPDGFSICHSCDNPACCNPVHLFLGTHQINMTDRNAKGRVASGERNGRAKLTWETVNAIRAAYVPFKVTLPMLAARFGVNRYIVSDILRNRTWKAKA